MNKYKKIILNCNHLTEWYKHEYDKDDILEIKLDFSSEWDEMEVETFKHERVTFKLTDGTKLYLSQKEYRNLEIFISFIEFDTLQKAADSFDISKERVRQIISKMQLKFDFNEIVNASIRNEKFKLDLIKRYFKINSKNFHEYMNHVGECYTFKLKGVDRQGIDFFQEWYYDIFNNYMELENGVYLIKREFEKSESKTKQHTMLLDKFTYRKRHERLGVMKYVVENRFWSTPHNENYNDPSIVRKIFERLKRNYIWTSLYTGNDDLTLIPPFTEIERHELFHMMDDSARRLLKRTHIVSFEKVFEELEFDIEEFVYFGNDYSDEIKQEQMYAIYKNMVSDDISLPRYPTIILGESKDSYDGSLLYIDKFVERKKLDKNDEVIKISYPALLNEFVYETKLKSHFLNNSKSKLVKSGVLIVDDQRRGWQKEAETFINVKILKKVIRDRNL